MNSSYITHLREKSADVFKIFYLSYNCPSWIFKKKIQSYHVNCKYRDIDLGKGKLRMLVGNCAFLVW